MITVCRRYEILSKAQLNNLKTVESEGRLPRGSRVVIFEGDSLAGSKVDARYVEAAVDKALDADAAQVQTHSSAHFQHYSLPAVQTTI